MKRMVIRSLFTTLCVFFVLGGMAAAQVGKYQYHVRGDLLMRGKYDDNLQALQAPKLLDPATTWGEMITKINHIGKAGGRGVCFDLVGLGADGKSIAPEVLKGFETAESSPQSPLSQIIWRRMGAMCKVFGEGAPEDPAYRMAVIETVARELGKRGECVYWIDGPEAGTYAAQLKKLAPRLVVAAPENGDILTVTALPEQPASQPILLVGSLPATITVKSNFVLGGGEEDFQRLETASMDPIELKPWTPDNSILSEEERNEGFIALFNGKNLEGWTITGENKQGFAARDGAIEWNGRGGQMLRSRDRYANYVLRLEWKIAPGKNNGLQLRTPRGGRNSKIGFEFQMLGTQFDTPNNESTASLYDVQPPLADSSKPAGEWNNLEITLDGPHYKAVLNGVLVQDVNFDENEELKYRLRDGFIVMSDHGGYAAFRNIRLKPLK
ncbi:MAG: DUF1080 domain-containing protein [FCB group bacterium]|jgi:hypothetical protein|nr:DUF1080 domain-containing protein [FCB group bacterium]